MIGCWHGHAKTATAYSLHGRRMKVKKIKIYGASDIEIGALDQFNSAMDLDWVKQGALMADAHLGYSLPIGGVVMTDGIVVPAWVGYDIGCGVCAIQTSYRMGEILRVTEEIYDHIRRDIPLGFKHNKRPVWWRNYANHDKTSWFNKMFFDKGGLKQLGTLGGGNHFIEIGYDDHDLAIWVVIHSGSRNIGHTTATNYMKEASYLHTGKRKAREGHYGFEITSTLGQDYLKDQNVCLEFALANRVEMLLRIEKVMNTYMEGSMDWDTLINRTHNHAEVTKNGVIHRKGATHAEKGMAGVIPGNMRDGSFITKGLGNPDSLFSSSHGAGRVLGRKKAKELLDVEAFEFEMDGIVSNVSEDTLDESPMAYKNIYKVMQHQAELVEVTNTIKPIINVKG
jgi:tRNA-splicing ligase RtcB